MSPRSAIMGQRAYYTGRDNIMAAFETLRNNNPYYSLWYGRDLFFQFPENDVDKGSKMLDQILEAAEINENTDIITIKFHPAPGKDGYITNKTEVVGTLPVRVVDFDNVSGLSGIEPDSTGKLAPPVYHMLKGISDIVKTNQDNNNLLMERFLTLQQPVEPVEVVPEKDWFDRISGIMEKPGVAELIGKILDMVPSMLTNQPNIRVAGVEEMPDPTKPVNNLANTAQKSDNGSEQAPAHIAENSDNISAPEPADIAQNSDTAAGGTIELELPGKIGGTIMDRLSNEDYDKVCYSLDTLSKHCDLISSIDKLANFAENNPDMFKQVLTNFIK